MAQQQRRAPEMFQTTSEPLVPAPLPTATQPTSVPSAKSSRPRARPRSFQWGIGNLISPGREAVTQASQPSASHSVLPLSPLYQGGALPSLHRQNHFPDDRVRSSPSANTHPHPQSLEQQRQQRALNAQLCPDPRGHDLATLLIHRTQQRHQRAWKRKRSANPPFPLMSCTGRPTVRGKVLQSLMCGIALIAILITYLALAFNGTTPIPISVHIILILLLIALSVALLHGILCTTYLVQHRSSSDSLLPTHVAPNHKNRKHYPSCRQHRRHHRRRHFDHPDLPRSGHIPIGADALPDDDSIYSPTTPVRVHLTRDEEADVATEKDAPHTTVTPSPSSLPAVAESNGDEGGERGEHNGAVPYRQTPESAEGDEEKITIIAPPPAYGLWRCSVRADPDLLHWRRVDEPDGAAETGDVVRGVDGSGEGEGVVEGRRPPSYVALEARQGVEERDGADGGRNRGTKVPVVGRGEDEDEDEEEAGQWPLRANSGMVVQDEGDVVVGGRGAPPTVGAVGGDGGGRAAAGANEVAGEGDERAAGDAEGSLQGLTRALLRRSVLH